jgi:hypothetical protein
MLTAKERGKKNRDAGKEFEDDIGETFEVYAAIEPRLPGRDAGPDEADRPGDARLRRQSPVRRVRLRADARSRGRAGSSAVFVGAELKTSDEPGRRTLPIVKAGNHGKGVAQHQLEALALVAKMGGHARIVWNNGGQVGVLENARIIHHQLIYEQSLASELRGKGMGAKGSRSIPWEAFKPVPLESVGGKTIIDWLDLEKK